MPTITTADGTEIFYKDWGSGQPIVFSHGWPLSADDWDTQMLFFLRTATASSPPTAAGTAAPSQVVRRPRHGPLRRRPGRGDRAPRPARRDPRRALHRRRRGRALHRQARREPGGAGVLISSVPPLMVQTDANPGGLPKSVFDDLQAAAGGEPVRVLPRPAVRPVLRLQPPRRHAVGGDHRQLVAAGHDRRAKAHYDGIVAFSQTDFTEDLKKISVPSWSCTAMTTRSCPTPTPGRCRPSWCSTGR